MAKLKHLTTVNENSLDARIQTLESTNHPGAGGLPARVQAIEDWHLNPAAYPGAPLTENYNTVSTLLGVLVGAVNATNIRVNSIQAKLISKGILAAS